ncbi:hypothetical protein [Sporolactobacillus spathodeae]|uniref:Apea-like HEPN domain-containing protein n=1 Tax=Sporolactobacillus spathodeae TaxID=1465502 RepID=A0ABS2Q7F3_9BACL|nr:hypothetical protein [Sporolactobacillus spathodeae]MBM7657722.1 hypothetical protein [Sporolactobacillus spathodeae]
MERKINDLDINGDKKYNTQQVFFIQRWFELLNVNTHSTYFVHYLNSHEALKELSYVVDLLINGEIRTEHHLKCLLDEARSIINQDDLFKKKAESQYKLITNALQQNYSLGAVHKLYSLSYQLNNVLGQIQACYLNWAIDQVIEIFDKKIEDGADDHLVLTKLNNTMKSLISELMGRGWSIQGLYSLLVNTIKEKADSGDSEDCWNIFFERLKSDKMTYICLFSAYQEPSEIIKDISGKVKLDILSGREVLDTYSMNGLDNHIRGDGVYIRQIINAFDLYAAVNESWQQIMKKYDFLNFYGYSSPRLNQKPIILYPNMDKFSRKIEVEIITAFNKAVAPFSIIEPVLDSIQNDATQNLAKRIRSVFEFSRISDESLSLQSAFINLWIALESFVQTKEYPGDIESITKVVSASELDHYIYGLVRNFYEDCRRCHVNLKEMGYDLESNWSSKKKVTAVLCILIDESLNQKLIHECKKVNTLLSYRCRCLSECLQSGKKVSKLMEEHQKGVSFHLLRLYRVRNAIVHTATTEYNISLFMKHLREYITLTVGVVLHRYNTNNGQSLEQTFTLICDFANATMDVLKNSRELDEETYIKLLLEGAF